MCKQRVIYQEYIDCKWCPSAWWISGKAKKTCCLRVRFLCKTKSKWDWKIKTEGRYKKCDPQLKRKWDWKIKTEGRYKKCDSQFTQLGAGVHQGWVWMFYTCKLVRVWEEPLTLNSGKDNVDNDNDLRKRHCSEEARTCTGKSRSKPMLGHKAMSLNRCMGILFLIEKDAYHWLMTLIDAWDWLS